MNIVQKCTIKKRKQDLEQDGQQIHTWYWNYVASNTYSIFHRCFILVYFILFYFIFLICYEEAQ